MVEMDKELNTKLKFSNKNIDDNPIDNYKVSRPHSAGHESEADVLRAKAVTKNSMQEPGSPQRPIRASSSHQSKEINNVLPANLKFGNKNIDNNSKDNGK